MSQKKAQLLNPLNGNLNVTGVVTASSFVGGLTGTATGLAAGATGSDLTLSGNVTIGGTLTYQDVEHIDSVGIITAQRGIQVLANGLDITGFSTFKTGVSVTGVVTATTFVGNLTGNVTGNTSGTAGGLTGTPDITVNNITGAAVTFSGDVSIPDKIKHTGDTTTAIRFPANNTVTVDTNGVERLRVDSTTGRLLLNTASTIASEPGEGHNPILQVAHVSGNVANLGISVSRFQASNPNSVPIILQKSRNSTIGSHTIVQDDDALGRIEFAGSDGAKFVTAASIIADVDGTPGTDDMPGRLQFMTTADGASQPTERLRISSTGKHTITGATNGELSIKAGSSSGNDIIAFVNSSGTTRGNITYDTDNNFLFFNVSQSERLRINSVGQISIRGSTTAFDTTGDLDSLQLYYETDSGQASIGPYSSGGSTHLSFYTNASSAAATEKLQITSGGNVNIGGNYTQTTYTMQVTGTLNATGNITQNGTALASTGKAIAMAMLFG